MTTCSSASRPRWSCEGGAVSPQPRPSLRTGAHGPAPSRAAAPPRDQDEGPGSVLSTASGLFPASSTGTTGWLGVARGLHLSLHHSALGGSPMPTISTKCSGGPFHVPGSRRLSYSPQSPSSLPPSCLCTQA